jgi:hypothetical protein
MAGTWVCVLDKYSSVMMTQKLPHRITGISCYRPILEPRQKSVLSQFFSRKLAFCHLRTNKKLTHNEIPLEYTKLFTHQTTDKVRPGFLYGVESRFLILFYDILVKKEICYI